MLILYAYNVEAAPRSAEDTEDTEARGNPLYLALAGAIAADVQTGRLKAGDRLPPHRDLADALGVTVTTVTRGYDEAERRGLIRGEVGRGTFVTPPVFAPPAARIGGDRFRDQRPAAACARQ